MSDSTNYGYFTSYNYGDSTQLDYTKIDADYVENAIETQDKFLKSVEYDKDNKDLVFEFHTSDGDNTVNVSVDDLADIYTAGENITIEDNVISANMDLSEYSLIEYVDDQVSSVLASMDEISSSLEDKADSDKVYSKEEIDEALSSISSEDIDLTNYPTTDEMNEAITEAVNGLDQTKADTDNVYTKTEIDEMVGDIASVLDAINGEII